MRAIIITIGDEILLGQIVDTNSRFIADRLTKIGIEVARISSVGDEEYDIEERMMMSLMECDIVVMTGGLGPTKDDVTKRMLSRLFRMELVEDPEVLANVERLIANGGMRMNPGNRSQALVPKGCRVLMNRKGTAPGMWFEKKGKVIVALPGVPFEMEDLMDREVVPALRERFPGLLLDYRVMKVYDIPESELALRLNGFEERLPKGLSLAYLPSPGMVRLRLTARGLKPEVLEKWMAVLRRELEGLRVLEGDEASLESEVVTLLTGRGLTLATAESCTGGNVAARVVLVAGASACFRGSVVAYANDVKERVLGVSGEDLERHGAVSEPVVRQMAEGARRLLGADYGVATSGVAGPTGGTPEKPVGTVWIAVASPEGTVAERFVFSFTRERNIDKATMKALGMLLDRVRASRG